MIDIKTMFSDITLFGETNTYEKTIDLICWTYEMAQHLGLGKLYVCFSGGKDSVVLRFMVERAAEKFKVPISEVASFNYNITGIDAPPLVYFIHDKYPDTICNKYEKSMRQLIIDKKALPTRIMRYCCEKLKEHGGTGCQCLTGVRWAESVKRKKRKEIEIVTSNYNKAILFNDNDENREHYENCSQKGKRVVNPIINWSDEQIWYAIKHFKIPYCKLYDCGFRRIGCVGCPMASKEERKKEFDMFPGMKQYYLSAITEMLNVRESLGMSLVKYWKTPQMCFDWWQEELEKEEDSQENQLTLFV